MRRLGQIILMIVMLPLYVLTAWLWIPAIVMYVRYLREDAAVLDHEWTGVPQHPGSKRSI
jgi:hypothetical protein